MAGLFHLFDTTNKNIHDSIKKNMDVLENYGMPLPDIVVAWQYSYYSMIASLIGEFLCAFSIGIILLIEGRKVYNTLIIK